MRADTQILDLWLAASLAQGEAAPADASAREVNSLLRALKAHWPEYLMEAAGLGIFMISACGFGTLLEHPASPVRQAVENDVVRRVLMGMAMALTAASIFYSPWGKQSGAHINPAVTLTFLRLGKVNPADAFFYVVAQFLGGLAGIGIAALFLGMLPADTHVNYVATLPFWGPRAAFIAEVVITFILMTVVLNVSNRPPISQYTGALAATLVFTYIALESPISGMSMNPARTLASAIPAHAWNTLWLYFTAPLLGMLLAAELYVRRKGLHAVLCAKLHHRNDKRCIFRCNFVQPSA